MATLRASRMLDPAIETQSPEVRRRYLSARLERTVASAFENAARVRHDLGQAGLGPRDVATLEDLRKIPVLRKDALPGLQAEEPPFGGLNGVSPGRLARIFMSPGPIYDPQGDAPDFWRFRHALAAKVTVGYQDGCLHPLWITGAGMRGARALGASAIWVPDHFMGFAPKWMWTPDVVPAAKVVHSMDALFDPVPILTLAALKHRKVWIGTSVTEPIRRHPMSLAQTFVTLDHISRGRAILGIGNGLRENTEPYGLPTDKRVNRLDEALRIIRMLWESRGMPVDFEGKFWTLKDAVFDLPLYKNKPPRIFVGAHFPGYHQDKGEDQ